MYTYIIFQGHHNIKFVFFILFKFISEFNYCSPNGENIFGKNPKLKQ